MGTAPFHEPVNHEPIVQDADLAQPGSPPTVPFEHAGAVVKKIQWENRGIVRSRFPMPWTDYNNDQLQAFRKRFQPMLDFAAEGTTEWEQLLRIRNWVHRAIPHNREDNFFSRPYPAPGGESPDPITMLETAGAGLQWWCPHFSSLLSLCLQAGGWVSRKVGNVSKYMGELGAKTHGVTDVFVNSLGKWVQLDAHFDVHYTIDGVPLDPGEIGQAWFEDGGKNVVRHVGLREEVKTKNVLGTFDNDKIHEAERAFWNRHILDREFLSLQGSWSCELMLMYHQSRHEGEICWQGQGNTCQKHVGYEKGVIQYTRRKADVYPDAGTARIELMKSETASGSVRVKIGTYTPNFDCVMVQVDGGIPQPRGTTFKWFLHEGENELKVWTRNKFGVAGKPSSVKAVLAKK